MSTVKIKVQAEGENLNVFDQASGKIQDMAAAARGAGKVGGMADLKAGFDMAMGAANTALQAIQKVTAALEDLNALGVRAGRADFALNSITSGQAVMYLENMRDATRGLVDDMQLATYATKGLGLGVISTADEAAKLAKYGSILGTTFLGDASKGVETLTLALSRVGLVQLMDNIGLSGENIRKTFNELKKTMPEQQAWVQATFINAEKNVKAFEGALGGTGTALERIQKKAENFGQSIAKSFSKMVDEILAGVDRMDKAHQKTAELASSTLNLSTLIGEFKSTPYMDGTGVGMKAPGMDSVQQTQLLQRLIASGQLGDSGFLYDQAVKRGLVAPADDPYAAFKRERGITPVDQGVADQIYKDIGSGVKAQEQAAQAAKEAAIAQHEAAQAALAEKRSSGLHGAFGTGASGTSNEVGGVFEQALQDRLRTVEGGDGSWRSQKQKAEDMAAAQEENKIAMDAYRLATGDATLESLAFEGAMATVAGGMKAQTSSVLEGAEAFNKLREMAEGGFASLQNLATFKLQWQLDQEGTPAAGFAEQYMRERGLLNIDESLGTGKTTPEDPFSFMKESADQANEKISVVGQTADGVANIVANAGVRMGNSMSKLGSISFDASRNVWKISEAQNAIAKEVITEYVAKIRIEGPDGTTMGGNR